MSKGAGLFSRLASKLTRSPRPSGSNETTPRTLRNTFSLRKSDSSSFSKPNVTLRPSDSRAASSSGSTKSIQGSSYICSNVHTVSSASDVDVQSTSRVNTRPSVPPLAAVPRNVTDSPLLNMVVQPTGAAVASCPTEPTLSQLSDPTVGSINFLTSLPVDSGAISSLHTYCLPTHSSCLSSTPESSLVKGGPRGQTATQSHYIQSVEPSMIKFVAMVRRFKGPACLPCAPCMPSSLLQHFSSPEAKNTEICPFRITPQPWI